ncbi:MAG: hypothetical protein O3A60_03600 [Planctomycetota bacterium]|nr:hypothetical protein [Planctomycetota bacterium]
MTRHLHRRRTFPLLALAVCGLAVSPQPADSAVFEEPFEGPVVSLRRAESDVDIREIAHARTTTAAHGGAACEQVVLEAATGTRLRYEQPIDPVRVIDELAVSLWVRANRPDIGLLLRVRLPRSIDRNTGAPVETIIAGSVSRRIDAWERLAVVQPAEALARQLPALRAEHGGDIDLGEANVTAVVLELYSSPGRYEVAVDDLEVSGAFPAAGGPAAAAAVREIPQSPSPSTVSDAAVMPAAYTEQTATATADDPPAGILRGVLEVAGMPFFPRVIDHNGEPLELLARLGFNTVRLREPADGRLLEEARQAGMWIICPPPELPDVDVRDPASLPAFSPSWNRVLMWDFGDGLTADDAEQLAERARRVKTCDLRPGRPAIASADSGLRTLSRHVDMLVSRRRVLGTSLELEGYLEWLRQQPRLARPGTPFMVAIDSEADPLAAAQVMALSGRPAESLPVDPGSLHLASYAAVAAGARGLIVSSRHRIDGDDAASRMRAAAVERLNIDLSILEPWAAAGRFASTATTSDPDVEAVVLEAVRARMVLAWRSAQGSQVVARAYERGLPDDAAQLTMVVPGVPEPHQAWLVTSRGLRPLKQRRVTGGVSVVIEGFRSDAFVLFSGDPAITGSVQRQLADVAQADLAARRSLASAAVMQASQLASQLPPAALGKIPVSEMLAEAGRDAQSAEMLLGSDPATARDRFDRAAAIGQQFTRLVWERGVVATGSIVAAPLCTSGSTLAEHWRFVETLAMTNPGKNVLTGGGMNRIDDLAGNGWRHFVLPQESIRTSVEISHDTPADGTGCLRMVAAAADPEAPPIVVETPPVWVTTPPLEAAPGRLIEIEAQVRVAEPLAGSVDGLLVFDNWGGPALAERVVGTGGGWKRLVLYRIPPAGSSPQPLVVTFATTGLGEVFVDEVRIRQRARVGEAGVAPAVPVATTLPPPGTAPMMPPTTPGVGPPPVASQAAPQAGTSWPGTGLQWPSLLPFGASGPPTGEGGGRVDPFKRARQGG